MPFRRWQSHLRLPKVHFYSTSLSDQLSSLLLLTHFIVPTPSKNHAYPQQNAPNLTTASKAHAHTELTASSLTNVLTAEVDTQLHPATTSLPKTSLTYKLQVRCLHDCILVPILSSPRAHKKKGERVTLNSCCSTVDCGCVRNFRESVRIWPVDAT